MRSPTSVASGPEWRPRSPTSRRGPRPRSSCDPRCLVGSASAGPRRAGLPAWLKLGSTNDHAPADPRRLRRRERGEARHGRHRGHGHAPRRRRPRARGLRVRPEESATLLWAGAEGGGPDDARATFASVTDALAGHAAPVGDVTGDGAPDLALRPSTCGGLDTTVEALVFDAASTGARDAASASATITSARPAAASRPSSSTWPRAATSTPMGSRTSSPPGVRRRSSSGATAHSSPPSTAHTRTSRAPCSSPATWTATVPTTS